MEAHSLPRNGRLFLPRSPKVLRALSDEKLVEQIRRGNEDAFEAVYDRHHRGILAFCRHMLASADEAEDAVQQTFISAYDAIHADTRELRLKPWLYTIARNRCLSVLRARREQAAELNDIPTAGLSEEVQHRTDLRELLHDLHDLPVDQRSALVLSEVGGLSHAEVGTIVGCEVAKVKSLVFQARSSLIETRNAREIPCHEIREQLATLTGGALRRGPLRRHLRACDGCTEFRDEVMRQRKALAAILPVVPTAGLKSSLLASIGIGGGGGGAAIGGGAAVTGGGIASFASSGAAVKVATVVVVGAVAVGGGIVLNEKAPTPQAEAASGQTGDLRAWPAPPAGAGPGARRLISQPGAPDHALRVGTQPAVNKGASKSPASSGPGKRHATIQPNANRGSQQRGGRRHGSRDGGPVRDGPGSSTSQPGTTAPAPGAQAPPATTGDDGDRSHGGHRGWTQGRGHDQHEQDYGGTHVPGGQSDPLPAPPPRDSSGQSGDEDDSHGGSGEQGGDGDKVGHDRILAPLTEQPPPTP